MGKRVVKSSGRRRRDLKRFTKIALGIAGFFGCVAVVCTVIALVMGFTLDDFQVMVREGKFAFKPIDGVQLHFFDEDDVIVDNDAHHKDDHHNSNSGESQRDIPHACAKIYVEYGAGTLKIEYADVECVRVIQKNVEKFALTTSDVDETIHVRGGLDVSNNSDAELTILLPRGAKLEELDLEIGASYATLDDIESDYMNITIGAGEAELSNLLAGHLNLEVGAGYAKLTSLKVGSLDVEVGVGEVDIEIAGTEQDYNYSVECGIGEVTIGSHSYSGLGAEENVRNPDATKEMDIECGIGEVSVRFIE